MKILYYDCYCGISGDMNLGALLDLGVPQEYLIKELEKLNLCSEYTIHISKELKCGIYGLKVDVVLKENEKEKSHRSLKDIENIINESDLNQHIKSLSLAMFQEVAKAEAKVHCKSIYEVHFHEVGAIDSIIDIVGAAICLDYLDVDKVYSSSVQLGGGVVKCAHGLMNVPAPATAEILRDIPVKLGLVQFETTTPTGAAILAANVSCYSDKTDFVIKNIGYGAGSRNLDVPNILRVYLGEIKEEDRQIEQYIIETNIDDMNPEMYEYVENQLFMNGALDVFKTVISMKKGRTAIKLSVLVDEEKEKNIIDVIFKETTSIGLRKYKVQKIMLKRKIEKVETKYGMLSVKKAYHNGKLIRFKPEYDECKEIAKTNNISLIDLYKEIDGELYGRKI